MKSRKLLVGILVVAGVFTSSLVYAQVKIGTAPTVIDPNSNLEVQAANNSKVVVRKDNGTVVIQNTPSGAITDSMMTVDASGNVRAINATKLRRLLGASGSGIMTRNTNQTFIPAELTNVDFTTLVMDEENGINLSSDIFTVAKAGVYTLSFSATTLLPTTAVPGRANIDILIYKSSAGGAWNPIGRNQAEGNTGSIITNTLTLLDNGNLYDRYRAVIIGCIECLPGNPSYTLSQASFYAFKNL